MSYPAAYVGESKFFPSLLLSLDDPLVNLKFLRFAIGAYIKNVHEANEHCSGSIKHLLSPLLAPPEILAQFPQCMI